MSISQEIINSIRECTALHELVGETVQLKRAGRNLVGLCPFHSEKSPSFSVNPEEGFYHCFGCSKHGSAFDFVMETRGLTFIEAVKFLGSRLGIEVRQQEGHQRHLQKQQEEEKKVLRLITKEVANFYRLELENAPQGGDVQEYLRRRGVDPQTERLFALGFAGESSPTKLLKFLQRDLNSETVRSALVQLGIIGNREDGSIYETFRARLIFPISRSDGAPIAFGGRIIEAQSDRPKYINSKESPIYSKRGALYGLSLAMPYLRRERTALLVEGYLDVIALAQAGFPTAVATCGTAVTPEHVEIFKRFCDRIIVVMDSDPAGQKAAAGCFELFMNSGLEVFGILLPEGEDPGSFLMGERAKRLGVAVVQEEFESLLKKTKKPILEHYLNYQVAQSDRTPAGLGRLSQRFVSVASRIKNAVEREASIRQAAQILGVSVDSMLALRRVKSESKRKEILTRNAEKTDGSFQHARRRVSSYLEQMLVSIISEPELSVEILKMHDSLQQLSTADFPLSTLIDVLKELATGEYVSLENFKDRSSSSEFDQYLKKLSSLLDRHGFEADILLAKAWSQVQIGGASPRRIVSEINSFSKEFQIYSEVELLRSQEREQTEEIQLENLVQKKLMGKRSLRKTQAN